MPLAISESCTRRLEFCAGHRVMGHENKCAHLHGHNYIAFITAEPKKSLDSIGRVVDFSVIKTIVGGWIDKHWDHGFILWDQDQPAWSAIAPFDPASPRSGRHSTHAPARSQKLYMMDCNPTAENLAAHLLEIANQLFATQGLPIIVTKVKLYETPNCFATAELERPNERGPDPRGGNPAPGCETPKSDIPTSTQTASRGNPIFAWRSRGENLSSPAPLEDASLPGPTAEPSEGARAPSDIPGRDTAGG